MGIPILVFQIKIYTCFNTNYEYDNLCENVNVSTTYYCNQNENF